MFKNEKGLTLIELLITIAVIAVVAAISVPVVSNVIAASNTNALNAMQEQVDQFVAEATQSGSVTLNGSTLEARIDQNGDGTAEYLVKTFPVDSKYTVSGTGDGPYTVALGAGASLPTGPVTLTEGSDWTTYTAFTSYGDNLRIEEGFNETLINALNAVVGTSKTVTVTFSDEYAGVMSFTASVNSSTVVGNTTYFYLTLVSGDGANGGPITQLTINN